MERQKVAFRELPDQGAIEMQTMFQRPITIHKGEPTAENRARYPGETVGEELTHNAWFVNHAGHIAFCLVWDDKEGLPVQVH